MEIRQKENELFEIWKSKYMVFVPDGVVNEQVYNQSIIKILYLLKEANGNESFDLRDFLKNGAHDSTWDNITRWTEGITNIKDEIYWEKLEKISFEQRKDILSRIVAMNIKKTPGGHTTNKKDLFNFAIDDTDYINKQFNLYNPDIVICCGKDISDYAFNYITALKDLEWKSTIRGVGYKVFNSNKVVIDFCHPEARVRDYLFFYSLIDAVKEMIHRKHLITIG